MNVYTPVGSKMLHKISGSRLWEVTTQHAKGHGSICVCQCDVQPAHPVSSTGERLSHHHALFPGPQERICRGHTQLSAHNFEERFTWTQTTRCSGQEQTPSASSITDCCFVKVASFKTVEVFLVSLGMVSSHVCFALNGKKEKGNIPQNVE